SISNALCRKTLRPISLNFDSTVPGPGRSLHPGLELMLRRRREWVIHITMLHIDGLFHHVSLPSSGIRPHSPPIRLKNTDSDSCFVSGPPSGEPIRYDW